MACAQPETIKLEGEGNAGAWDFEADIHWLSISSFSVKELVKNIHYFLHFFSLKKQVKNLKNFQHFLTCFKIFTLKTKKW
jgi:hypothetical protein